MEWIFATAVLILFVYHRTFRAVVSVMAGLAALAGGIAFAAASGWFTWAVMGPVIGWSLHASALMLVCWLAFQVLQMVITPHGRQILHTTLHDAWQAPDPELQPRATDWIDRLPPVTPRQGA